MGIEIANRLGDGAEKHFAGADVLAGEIRRQPHIGLHPVEGPQSKYERVLGDGDIESGVLL
jgi:hypothetical protein